jgi:hypothetical protein
LLPGGCLLWDSQDNINPDCGNVMQIFNIQCGGIHQSIGLEGLKYKTIKYCALSYKSVQLSPWYIFSFPWRNSPYWAGTSSLSRLHDHTLTHHIHFMFFWPCIINWLYIDYQLDALIIIYSQNNILLYMFRASSAHLQEDTVVHKQHMALSLSMRVLGGLSVQSLSENWLEGEGCWWVS